MPGRHRAARSGGRCATPGLVDVGTSAVSAQVDSNPQRGIPQWELLAEQLAPGLVAAGLVTEADLAAFGDLMHDGVSVVFAPLLVSSWGRRPSRAEG